METKKHYTKFENFIIKKINTYEKIQSMSYERFITKPNVYPDSCDEFKLATGIIHLYNEIFMKFNGIPNQLKFDNFDGVLKMLKSNIEIELDNYRIYNVHISPSSQHIITVNNIVLNEINTQSGYNEHGKYWLFDMKL